MSGGESSTNSLKSITPESLALSASLFTTAIDSWVPKDFGVVKSDGEKKREFEQAFSRPVRGVESADRLGLGHPLLSVQRSDRPNGSSSHSSLSSLAKHLNSKKPQDISLAGPENVEEEDEDEESRSRSLGKGMKGKSKASILDPFAGKKKKRKALGDNLLANDDAGPSKLLMTQTSNDGPLDVDDAPNEEGIADIPNRSQTSSPGGSGEFPFTGPISIPPRFTQKTKKRNRRPSKSNGINPSHESKGDVDEEDGAAGEGDDPGDQTVDVKGIQTGGDGKKSKTQLRREKRKKRKLELKGDAV